MIDDTEKYGRFDGMTLYEMVDQLPTKVANRKMFKLYRDDQIPMIAIICEECPNFKSMMVTKWKDATQDELFVGVDGE